MGLDAPGGIGVSKYQIKKHCHYQKNEIDDLYDKRLVNAYH